MPQTYLGHRPPEKNNVGQGPADSIFFSSAPAGLGRTPTQRVLGCRAPCLCARRGASCLVPSLRPSPSQLREQGHPAPTEPLSAPRPSLLLRTTDPEGEVRAGVTGRRPARGHESQIALWLCSKARLGAEPRDHHARPRFQRLLIALSRFRLSVSRPPYDVSSPTHLAQALPARWASLTYCLERPPPVSPPSDWH